MSLITRRNRGAGWRSALTRVAAREASRFLRRTQRRVTRPNQNNNRQAQNNANLSSVNPLTTQHDFKVDYTKRKLNRRKRARRRRARKFTRRVVNSYMRYTTTPKHVAKLAQFTRECNEGQSAYFACLLHTSDGESQGDNPQADWREFFREGSAENAIGWDNIADPIAGPTYPDINRRNRAMRCVSAAMELTVRNTGSTPALVNVYRVVCKRNFPFPDFTLESLYEQGFRFAGRITEVTQPVEGTGDDGIAPPYGMWDSQITPTMLVASPFQSRLFTQHFTIYRRTKYQLSPGEEFSLMLKDSRPKYINMNTMRGNSFVSKITHGFFVDFQGVPIRNGGETTSSGAFLSVQKMVRYSINMLPEKRTATSFDVQDP